MAYGSVWVSAVSAKKCLPPSAIAKVRRDIEREIRKNKLTFCRHAPVARKYISVFRSYGFHVAADVIWDDQYDAMRVAALGVIDAGSMYCDP